MRTAVFLFLALLPQGIRAAEPLPLAEEYWQEPAFVKSFNGTYRIEARIEPTVTTEERGLLVEVQELMTKGQRSNALAKLEASPLSAKSAALTFNIGNLHFEKGDDDKAIAAFKKAIEMYPSFRRAHRNLAMALARAEKMEEALEHLLEAIRLGEASGAAYGLLGYCRLERGEWASALQAYRLAQISEPEVVDWKAGMAQCLQQTGGQAEAAALLDEVIRQRPGVASYALLQSAILLALDRPEDAVKTLELPRRLGTLGAHGMLTLADLHLRQGRLAQASQRVDEAMAMEPKPATGDILSLAHLSLRHQHWPLAKTLVAALQDRDSEGSRVPRLKGLYLIQSGEDPAKGEEILREIIAKVPDDGDTLLALGRHLAQTNKPAEAELLLERSTATGANAAEAWLEIVRLRVDRRDFAKALEALDEVLALESTDALLKYRENLQNLVEAAE